MVEGMRPKSRGRIIYNVSAHLNDEMADYPSLGRPDFRYFNDPSDFDVMIEGIQIGLKIFEMESFKDMKLILDPRSIPELCNGIVYNSREFWKCFIAMEGRSIDHFSGSCKMGNKTNDRMAVVDGKLK